VDGLSDNVTWYFARGPRQSTSLDGSYASKDPNDRRIFNWTAIFDETADFELNTRGVSGGVGAIVKDLSSPPNNNDRIDLLAQTPPQQGLQGSAATAADPTAKFMSKLTDWEEVDAYLQTIRSPRKPSNLPAADVMSGRDLFQSIAKGNCVGCHSGAKWTLSKVFYKPGDVPNAATNDAAVTSLSNVDWKANATAKGFPVELFPSVNNNPTRMRFGNPPGAEQLQCALRPVGTFAVSPADVKVVELRGDMVTPGQGNADSGKGFNVPSLLGMQVGAPYFHAGNARTLEEALGTLFKSHYQTGISKVFNLDKDQVKAMTAYILAIDEDEMPVAVPALGKDGGDLCFYP
jgi:mono/diheme cytochrome c family protein